MTQPDAALAEHEIVARLSAAGLRSTAPRRETLRVVSRGEHWSAAAVFEAVARRLPGTSLQAVYGVLAALTEAGVLRKIEPPGSPALYELHVGDHHHHLVCIDCGEIRDVPCSVGEAPCLGAGDDHGYVITAAEVTYRGVCPSCQAAAQTTSPFQKKEV